MRNGDHLDVSRAHRALSVIARVEVRQDLELATVIKEARGRGADLVVLDGSRSSSNDGGGHTEFIVAATDDAGVVEDCVPVAVLWTGELDSISKIRDAHQPVALAHVDPTQTTSSDWLVRTPEQVLGGERPGGVGRYLCDLGARADRGELAALVTVALERGVDGFITTRPRPVRRAAQIIRAVEGAE